MSIFDRNKKEPSLPNELSAETLAEQLNDKAVERGMPELHVNKKSNVGKVFITGVMVLALMLLIFSYISFSGGHEEAAEEATTEEQQAIRNSRPINFETEQAGIILNEPKPEPAVQANQEQAAYQANVSDIGEWGNTSNATGHSEPTEPDRRLQGAAVIDVNRSGSIASQAGEQLETGRETILSNRLSPTVTASAKARQRADLTYLLKKGTNISCTLDTKIVTTHPGITRCIVNKDVYSSNGKVLLVERGSEIIGEQTTALLQGQARVFVLWNTIDTPNGVTLDINSPSADSLGASGQPAQVDTHFWKRFGGAIMLSLIDDGLVIMGDRVSQSGNTVSYDNTSDAVQNMATEALKNTINIPPTGYVNQGELVNVMVARDVDFRSVYELIDPYFYTVK
ncbi:type IV secretion system protein VirB10 [Advenella alkanexedens]|uniref:type IV secretion system protein VirB10 n=1 Tax=Advenella alkanexedens TaxID=1481665 RepID=UPI002675838F|nr:type IV secretion system protein VirB10 [Advenella alkanexedens]WKU18776.1 type IV secretion system protein VirB10 [Advenella alkanexedens]